MMKEVLSTLETETRHQLGVSQRSALQCGSPAGCWWTAGWPGTATCVTLAWPPPVLPLGYRWYWPGQDTSDQVPGGSSWVLTILETIARWSTGDIVKDPTDLTSTNPGIINTYIHIYTHISGLLDSSGFIYLINNEFVKFSIIGWIFILQCVELYLIWYNDILEYCNFLHIYV